MIEESESFLNTKSSASGCCLAFAWFFANFTMVLLIKKEQYNLQERRNTSLFLAVNGFNTNLVQFLNFYRRIMLLLVTCISDLLRARSTTCIDAHLKQFCVHEISCTKIIIYEGLSNDVEVNVTKMKLEDSLSCRGHCVPSIYFCNVSLHGFWTFTTLSLWKNNFLFCFFCLHTLKL